MTDKTDHELLELAAKAAGIELYGYFSDDLTGCLFFDIGVDVDEVVAWNPLEDDGDAWRLAVKLNIWPVRVFSPKNHPDTIRVQKGSEYWTEIAEEEIFDDPLAATRRAIVRAAAEIGKGME